MKKHELENTIESGNKAYQKGDYPSAANYFEKAWAFYSSSDDVINAAEMANNLSVARLKMKDGEGALTAALGTEKVFQEIQDIRREAIALGNQAAALEFLGESERALELYEKCSVLLKETDEKELRAYVLSGISAIQLKTGKQFQAMASMDAALENKNKLSLKEKFLQKLLKVPFRMINKK